MSCAAKSLGSSSSATLVRSMCCTVHNVILVLMLIIFSACPAVNTASRMESNGVKGKIHCSEATANCLRASEKGQWLTPREEKVIAKGKGEMYVLLASTAVCLLVFVAQGPHFSLVLLVSGKPIGSI